MIARYDNYNVYSEIRMPIFGLFYDEWKKLAVWFIKFKMFELKRVRWMVDLPRTEFSVVLKDLPISSFQDSYKNVFMPLFEATNNPNENQELHQLLQHVTVLDNDSGPEGGENRYDIPDFNYYKHPAKLRNPDFAPYDWVLYWTYANLVNLNKFRKQRGFTTLVLRPHVGEHGPVDHQIGGWLIGSNIQHGLEMRNAPVIEYLYYLSQVGIGNAPTSTNYLWIPYEDEPFYNYFSRGQLISINSDNPAQFGFTADSLFEEYTTDAKVWKLSNSDLSEIARNSILISNFPHEVSLFLQTLKANLLLF